MPNLVRTLHCKRGSARKVGIEHLPLLSCLVGASSDFYRFRDIGRAALGFDVDTGDVFADHTQRYQNEPAHQKEHAQKRRIARWHGRGDKLLDNDFDQQNQPATAAIFSGNVVNESTPPMP